MPDPNIATMQGVISSKYCRNSTWLYSVIVKHSSPGEATITASVEVFDMKDCAIANRCYAWFKEDSKQANDIVIVLHNDRINSANKAFEQYARKRR